MVNLYWINKTEDESRGQIVFYTLSNSYPFCDTACLAVIESITHCAHRPAGGLRDP